MWSPGESIWCPGEPFYVAQASILRVPGHLMAAFCRFCIKIAELLKTIEKRRFSNGFLMISGVRRASKSMKNMKKLIAECLGTPKSRQRSAGLAGLAAQVDNAGPMGAQWKSNGGPRGIRIANDGI